MFKKLNNLDYMRLIPEETTKAVSRLEFLAYNKIEGFINGKHSSPNKGSSVEFAEHRIYTSGDDVKNIDWRVYAKNDRYYVKQYQEETNLNTTIIVDASASMSYKGTESTTINGGQVSKFEYAQYLAAAFSYLLIKQQDAVGLVTFDSKVRSFLPPKSSPTQIRQILKTLHNCKAKKETNVAEVFSEVAKRIHQRGVVIIISDLFDDPEKIINAIHNFGYRKHEVILFHIMADEELTFPFKTFTEFQDIENSGHSVEVDPKAIKATYLERVREFIRKIEKGCHHIKGDYIPVSTKEDFTEVFSNYLLKVRKGRS